VWSVERAVHRCNSAADGSDRDYVSMSQHPSYHGRARRKTPPAEAAVQQPAEEPVAVFTPAARHSGRACCCAALPAVIAVLAPSASRPSATDLLLCGHHYRASLAALAARGATILDIGGHPLTADAWPEPGPVAR
jgi:hypothetical protein